MPALIVVDAGKKKGSMPPPEAPGKKRASAPGGMPPPSLIGDERATRRHAAPDPDDRGIAPDEVGYNSDDLCSDCAHAEGGTCSRYSFAISPNGHCKAGFEPQAGEGQAFGDEGEEEGANPFGGRAA
jgi:hypothetical protein